MIRFEQVMDGMEHGDIAVVDSPNDDGAVCKIGDNWFYFGGQEAEEMTAAEYLANVPKDEIAKEILGALEDFRHDPGFADEYGYYEAFLNERAAKRNPGWRFYIVPDLMTWSANAEHQTPMERFEHFEDAKARFAELRSQRYNIEEALPTADGRSCARLTLGLESPDGRCALDILHVHRFDGSAQNYLVTDFSRMEQTRDNPAVREILTRVSEEIGFDRVEVYEQGEHGYEPAPDVSFDSWDNPYFDCDSAGRIAAELYQLTQDHDPHCLEYYSTRQSKIAETLSRFQSRQGLALLDYELSSFCTDQEAKPEIRERAKALRRDFIRYKERRGLLARQRQGLNRLPLELQR